MRPYPSLRITFTSPALRIPGLLQTRLLDRIGGPPHIREGILDALAHGTSVTAKIAWLTSPASSDPDSGPAPGKPRWIHCTPLLGSDERVGVWMIVMVENEEVTGQLNRHVETPLSGMVSPVGAASPKFTGNKLYAEYLRREGRPDTPGSAVGSARSGPASAAAHERERERERKEVDDQFRDF